MTKAIFKVTFIAAKKKSWISNITNHLNMLGKKEKKKKEKELNPKQTEEGKLIK